MSPPLTPRPSHGEERLIRKLTENGFIEEIIFLNYAEGSKLGNEANTDVK
jgi:hypothetical protein